MRVRPPAVAGTFYSDDPERLRSQVDAFLAGAAEGPRPKALVVPHAGYIHSGAIAAVGYRAARQAPDVRRVIVLGPSHFVRIHGLALPEAEALQTPLGTLAVDADAVAAARALPQVVEEAEAHAREHSIEVQLPFLQRAFPDATVLPLSVGSATPSAVAEVLEALWGGPETLVVISSDLSHYLPYDEATRIDRETAERVVKLGPPLESHRACGSVPLNGLLHLAKRRGLRSQLLDLRNSGDTAGPRDGVVGYGAFALHEASA